MKYFWDRIPANDALMIICIFCFSSTLACLSVVAISSSLSAAVFFLGFAVFFGLMGMCVSIFTAAEIVVSEIKNLLPKQDVSNHDPEGHIQPKFD